MSQNVIIRPKMDFSNKADNCYSDHVLSDKFPAKSSKLSKSTLTSEPREGQLVYDKKRWIGKIRIKLLLHSDQ